MRSRRVIRATFAAALTLGTLGSTTSPADAVGVVPNVPDSISADCSRDVTADINAWIAARPDRSTLTFAPGGCYRVDGTLRVKDRVGLTIDGNGSTFRAMTDGSELVNPRNIRTRSMWNLLGNTDLTMRNVVAFGANPHAGVGELAYRPKFEAQHAFLVMGSLRTVLDHVEAYDVYGDFVWVGPGTNTLAVRNSTFARNGRQGWTINGTNILFENNTITDTRRATIDMEPSLPTWGAQNVTIRNNTVGRGRLFFFASVGAAAPMDNINIIGNRLVGRAMSIYVAPPKGTRSHYRVIGNTATGARSGFGAALVFRHVNDLEIRGNSVPLQYSHGLHGVAVFDCERVAISDNVFRNGKGVYIDRGYNVDVRQWNNLVGVPAAIAPTTHVAGPTPLQIR